MTVPAISKAARQRIAETIEAGVAMDLQWATDIEMLLKFYDAACARIVELDALVVSYDEAENQLI